MKTNISVFLSRKLGQLKVPNINTINHNYISILCLMEITILFPPSPNFLQNSNFRSSTFCHPKIWFFCNNFIVKFVATLIFASVSMFYILVVKLCIFFLLIFFRSRTHKLSRAVFEILGHQCCNRRTNTWEQTLGTHSPELWLVLILHSVTVPLTGIRSDQQGQLYPSDKGQMTGHYDSW